jgi:hypothetical protein
MARKCREAVVEAPVVRTHGARLGDRVGVRTVLELPLTAGERSRHGHDEVEFT